MSQTHVSSSSTRSSVNATTISLLPCRSARDGRFLPPLHIDRVLTRLHSFVFEGLSQLADSMLISGARHIHLANEHGVRKIFRDITTTQQGLRMLSSEDSDQTELSRAKQYYSLYSLSPAVSWDSLVSPNMPDGEVYQDLISSVRRKPVFSFDEYNIMLNLQCGVDQSKGDAGAQTATDRNYSMYVIDLHAMELESGS
jgi:exocyst complex component 4